MLPRKAVELFGGIASWAQLESVGCEAEQVRISVNYGRIIRIRKGWFAATWVPEEAVRAWRIGGRLACVSALAFHGELENPGPHEPIHLLVPRAAHLRLRPGESAVVHWTRRPPTGTRLAVPVELARRQAAHCDGRERSLPTPSGPASPHPR